MSRVGDQLYLNEPVHSHSGVMIMHDRLIAVVSQMNFACGFYAVVLMDGFCVSDVVTVLT